MDSPTLRLDLKALAHELLTARSSGQAIAVPPSARDQGFDLSAAYDVEAEIARTRVADGHATVGYKVGFANKAVWRLLGLETLVWAHMYADTVHYAHDNTASLAVAHLLSPKIEPEIVFTMKQPMDSNSLDPAAALDAVESIALGFEIIDCPFPDWKFQPPDFVAASGFHAALIVGERHPVHSGNIANLVERLPRFKVRLMKDGQLVEEGSGRNVLRSPALCLAELASAMARHPTGQPLTAGDLVSTGTLTESQPITAGETWTATIEGLELPVLTLRFAHAA